MSNKQETLFEEEQKQRTRNVETFVRVKSRDGSLSVTIDPDIAQNIRKYCKIKNLNCKKLIEQILEEEMEKRWPTRYDSMSREDLLKLVKRMEAEKEGKA